MTSAPRIAGVGSHRPARIVTNDELALSLDTNDEWIRRRTGISSRMIAGGGETVVAMAAEASRKALADAGVDPSEVDLTILATCSSPTSIPGGAASIATAIGAGGAGAFDINAACAGFCYALSTAADAVRAGSARKVVVAASERMSDIVDWNDRSSAILFGDGAGAVVVTDGARDGEVIGPVVAGSDGSLAGLIELPEAGKLKLDGQAVFRWAVGTLGKVAEDVCARAGVPLDRIAAFIPHQANGRIIDSLAKSLGFSDDVVIARDVADAANTSSASVPLALAQLRDRGEVSSGDLALFLGFGAGLTWAGQIATIP